MAKLPRKKFTVFDKVLDQPFESYWNKEAVQEGLKRKQLIQGTLRINPKNFEEAFIDDPAHGPDYFISGLHARNRAFNNDIVVVQVLPEEQWIKCDVGIDEASDIVPSLAKLSLSSHDSKKDSYPTETLVDRLYSNIHLKTTQLSSNSVKKRQETQYTPVPMTFRRVAKVVYIVERVHSRACAGYLKAYDKSKNLALFSPRDSRIPRIFVSLSKCPQDFCQKQKNYESHLFICFIEHWQDDAPFPFGKLMRSLGEAGEIEAESEAFLIENDVDYSDFPPEVLDCLPKESPWTIPQEEIAKRRDFRNDCVFTIDPETAKDLDDALHLKVLKNDVYEVGVHIADVSHFVHAGSMLDHAASRRATSVYLVQKVVPMLPALLCEKLCSLNPNEDRLSFSVVWRISEKGKFLSEWIGKSIIRSCAKLSYDHAQLMIAGEPSNESFPQISGGHSLQHVTEAVKTLNQIATEMRSQRISKGTLRLNQPKLSFSIEPTTGLPNGCHVHSLKESNRLIEEFMLMANMTVARKIYEAFPDKALLRRHPPPKLKSAELLRAKFASYGISLDTSSAVSLQRSLDCYSGQTSKGAAVELEKMVLTSHCARIMELAKYFCTGCFEVENYKHYALNVPFYTHFTSPIRRYADVIVHRQLVAAIGGGSPVSLTSEELQRLAVHCNQKKKAAKTVGELSAELFLAVFIKECGPLHCKGMVISVLDKACDIFVQEFGIIKRVYCERMDSIKSFKYEKHGHRGAAQLTLEKLQSSASGSDSSVIDFQVLTIFTMIEVTLVAGSKSSLQFDVVIL